MYFCTRSNVELKEKDNMEELSFDNILGEQEIDNLFAPVPERSEAEEPEEAAQAETADEEERDDTTEVVDPETLFQDPQPESVGSGDKAEGDKEDAVPEKDGGTSPQNFYSSIASALAVDGIFLNSDEESIKKVDTAEAFSDLLEAEINARLDEKQRRIDEALSNGVEPTDIKKYENTLNVLHSVTDAQIAEESESGENLRRQLIYQDFLNKGYTPEKAQKFTERTIDAGTDIEDAKEALQGNKEFFQAAYNQLLSDAQKKADAIKKERKEQDAKLKESILKDKFGDLDISKDMRKKAYENLAKPVYRDPQTGDYLTAIQQYEREHRSDFLKYVSMVFTMTNGFKDFESFTKGKVKKEVKKGLRELEHTLNSTSRQSDGSFRMVSKAYDDPESYITKGIKLDL